MAGYDATYEGLENMILRDHYFLTRDKSLQTFLKEKSKLNLKEMTKAANDYYEAHGYPSDHREDKVNKTNSCLIKTNQTLDSTIRVSLQFHQDYTVIIVV